MSPIIALVLAVSVAANVWLYITRRADRVESAHDLDLLYATSWAAIHAVNGTTPADDEPEVADELDELLFCAAVHRTAARLYPDRSFDDLTFQEQSTARFEGRRELVLAGAETLDDMYDADRRELEYDGRDPAIADMERTVTEAMLAAVAASGRPWSALTDAERAEIYDRATIAGGDHIVRRLA